MVRREANGSTLYFIDADGVKQEFTPVETSYNTVQATQDLQISATLRNRQRRANYMTALSNAQVNEDASRPYPPPVAEKMIVVTDPTMDEYGFVTAGVESEVDWNPPLPTVRLKK